jgi:hypothetical protein
VPGACCVRRRLPADSLALSCSYLPTSSPAVDRLEPTHAKRRILGAGYARQPTIEPQNLYSIFQQLDLTNARTAEAFPNGFRERGFYFVHAIKCFSRAALPREAAARRELVRVCAQAHLGEDLTYLQPERVCLLGEVPRNALAQVCPDLHLDTPAKQGYAQTVQLNGGAVSVLSTCFPDWRYKNVVKEHFDRWPALGPLRLTEQRG